MFSMRFVSFQDSEACLQKVILKLVEEIMGLEPEPYQAKFPSFLNYCNRSVNLK